LNAPDVLPGRDPGEHIASALKAARTGRNLQPLVPGPHMRLGTFSDRLTRTEPYSVHFDRAKRVGLVEPDVWYVCGKAAADRGDWPTALADWKQSLTLAPRRLPPIARTVAGNVAPDVFRAKGLPDDPALWYAATPHLFPDSNDPERAKWLRAIVDRCARTEPTSAQGFMAWGSALEELKEGPASVRVWRRAVELYPDNIPLRNFQATRLEAEEMYEDAIPVLEWLIEKRPDDWPYPVRLAAAKHALKLKAEINGK
jgi:tetratricopeptide (TPR) repeat protein